jgi:hypothetical protein
MDSIESTIAEAARHPFRSKKPVYKEREFNEIQWNYPS